MKRSALYIATSFAIGLALAAVPAKAADPVTGAMHAVGQGTFMAPHTAYMSLDDHARRYGPIGLIPGAIAAGLNVAINAAEVPFNAGAALVGRPQPFRPSPVRF